MPNKVYFITGANRGIGLEIVKILSSDSSNTVLASARDQTKAVELNKLTKQNNVHIINLDVSSEHSINGLDDQLARYAPDGIDYFISNAGICSLGVNQEAVKVPREEWISHFTTNTLGPVLITQKVLPFLAKKDTKVIYFVTSLLGSIGGFFPVPTSAYGMSKAALNHLTRTLANELGPDGYTVICVHPGVVTTDMAAIGRAAAEARGDTNFDELLEKLGITPVESATAQIKLLEGLTEKDNSKFFSYTGEELPW